MEFVLEPITITKELILNRVSEEKLMEHYLGVPVKKGLLKSPLRKDNRPTCAFYRSKRSGRLIFKDFAGFFAGDFVSVVMYKFNCSYGKALQIIANDFGIIQNKNLQVNEPLIKYSNTKFEDTTDAIIQAEIKDFEQYELDWWAKFGIDLQILKKFKVFSCKNVFLNNNLFHLYKDKQLVFGYFGGIREDIERWRIYFPGNKKYKFISNWKSFRLQGSHMLPKTGEYLVVTKSLKDVMTLYSLSISAIAPISENCFLSESQYNRLKERFKYIVLLYDNDRPGLRSMVSIKKKFPEVIPVWIPWKYNAKDISDFYAKYKRDKTVKLIDEAKEYIKRKADKSAEHKEVAC